MGYGSIIYRVEIILDKCSETIYKGFPSPWWEHWYENLGVDNSPKNIHWLISLHGSEIPPKVAKVTRSALTHSKRAHKFSWFSESFSPVGTVPIMEKACQPVVFAKVIVRARTLISPRIAQLCMLRPAQEGVALIRAIYLAVFRTQVARGCKQPQR